jgi:hypothetical protein
LKREKESSATHRKYFAGPWSLQVGGVYTVCFYSWLGVPARNEFKAHLSFGGAPLLAAPQEGFSLWSDILVILLQITLTELLLYASVR